MTARAPGRDLQEHQLERTVASHLVGEIGPIGGTGVAGLKLSGHRPQFAEVARPVLGLR